MGILTSKVDTSHLETIESNIVDLTIRASEEQQKIDQNVKKQIFKALGVYSKCIENVEEKGYMSSQKALNLKQLIAQAMKNLEKLPHGCVSSHTEKKYMTPNEMRNYIFDVEKRLKHIGSSDCKTELETIILYSQNLENKSRFSMTLEEEDRISVLVLKLFLKSNITKASNVLADALSIIESVTKNTDSILLENITAFDAEAVICKLEKINDKLEESSLNIKKSITQLKSQVMSLDESNNFCHGSKYLGYKSSTYFSTMFSQGSSLQRKCHESHQYQNVIKQVEKDLDKYGKIVETLRAPVGMIVITKVKDKVSELITDHLDSVPDNCCAKDRKRSLIHTGMGMINKLIKMDEENKEICHNLEVLKCIEEEIRSMDTNLGYQEKKDALKSFSEMANQIDTLNNDVQIQKTEIVNKIEGFLLTETMFYLRNIKKSVEQYKAYAKQFAYPEWVKEYEAKFDEIYSMKKCLEIVPKGRHCVEVRRNMINQEIDETLKIFKEKVADNGNVLSFLNFLENIVNKINYYNNCNFHSRLQKLKIFNEVRKEIESFSSNNHRLRDKKRQILCQLRDLEKNLYFSRYPEQLKEMKVLLDDYEKDATHISYQLESIQKYQQMMKKLHEIRQIVKSHYMNEGYIEIFLGNVDLVLELLRAALESLKSHFNKSEELNKIKDQVSNCEANFSNKIEILEECQKVINVLKTNGNDDLLNIAETVETTVAVERAKIEFIQMNQALQKLQKNVAGMSRPISAEAFITKLEELFALKECVDDMPRGNPELDTQKVTFLKGLFIIFKNLDGDVFNFVANKKRPENILALQKHFNDFDPDVMRLSKNSIEFIQMLRRRAESFENRIKNYLGTNSSVEYYVIHENLMRLLEELDKLSCDDNDSLLQAIVEAVTYIKKLIEELNSNACNE